MARQLMAIGVAAIIVIGVLQAWGGAYQVARLQRQRAVLQPTVAPLVALRDSLLAVHEARTALVLGRAQARWSERLSALAETLPDGAYFTAFRGAGDSVVVEGTASDAQTAVARLKSGRGVRLVRPTAAAASTDDDREPFSAVVFFGAGGTR
jgi:Tfp pilus assembly protein PilN